MRYGIAAHGIPVAGEYTGQANNNGDRVQLMLAGAPARIGGSYVLASRGGTVWRIDAATGRETGKLELGVPLALGPTPIGHRLLLIGHDGTLYQSRQP